MVRGEDLPVKQSYKITIFISIQLILILLHIYKESSYIQLLYAQQKELRRKQQLLEKKEYLELELYSLYNHEDIKKWALDNGMTPITLKQCHTLVSNESIPS